MTPRLRSFVLTAHITFSVGWLGAVVTFLVFVIVGMTASDAQVVRLAWIAMGLIGQWVLIPFALISLLSGLLIALGTKWGLFKHYWVSISLVLTLIAVFVLLGNMQTVSFFASIAAEMNTADDMTLIGALPSELLHAGLGLLVLLVIQVLNVYKPKGITPYGWRKQQEQRALATTQSMTL
jgi:hypothetical protein